MLDFLHSEHILALLIAVSIFIITILLVGKRWISFPVAILFLLISLAAGLIINHKQEMQNYFSSSPSREGPQAPKDFHQYMLQGMEDLKTEITTEKENLRRVMNQVQEIFDSMDAQKQKLQHFIEEVREQFKTEKMEPPADSIPVAPSEPSQPSQPSQHSPSTLQTPDHKDVKDEKDIKDDKGTKEDQVQLPILS